MVMKWMGLILGVLLLIFLIQNWQPWVPLIILGQPIMAVPLGLGFLCAFILGLLCAWGLDQWFGGVQKHRSQDTDEPIVLEPDYIEYP
ncbi:MAG: hypothetical protein Q6K90_08150, partial [Gloeomargarita sp. HHBFW_bins_162]